MSPRHKLKRYLPSPERLAGHPRLRWLGPRLFETRLWHLSRHATAQGLALGLLCAWLPVPGHMLVVAPLAVWLRVNVPVAIAGVWITNPITIPPFFYAAYRLGAWLLGAPTLPHPLAWSWTSASRVWEPLVLGCAVLGSSSAVLGYWAVQSWWRWHVSRRWRARRQRRAR